MEELRTNAKRLSPEEQYQLRKSTVRLLKKGHTPIEVAEMLDVSRSSVYATKKSYDEKGIDGIKPQVRGRRTGDKRILTPEQERQIRNTIVDKNPEQLKLKCCMWTRKSIHEYILRDYKVDLPLSTLGYYLARWGFSVQRPTKRANKQDDARMQKWMDEEYPGIVEKSRSEDAEIYWGDETAIQNTANYIKGYAPVGKTPVLKIEAKKLKLNMLSAISNKGKLRFTITKESVNADILIDFMRRLVKDSDRKVLLILDNLRVHHSKKVQAWLSEHVEEIELFYLPPYAPEYNPDEYLNSDLKREMSKRLIPKSEKELRSNARSVLKKTQLNPNRVMSYFGTKYTKYAKAESNV
jgi:transposase